MTHSLHRCGKEDALKKDYVFLCTPAKGVNQQGVVGKLINILNIIVEAGPANIGFYGYGSLMDGISIEEVKKGFHENSRLRCCFDDKEKLKTVLRRIKDEDSGLSITVSGLISELKEISEEINLKPHTVNLSCGVFGNLDRLPHLKIREITTMCGHGMISHRHVDATIQALKEKKIERHEAVHQLAKPCTCGIFNPTRAKEIVTDIMRNDSGK